jgi:hypothetical protein
MIPMKTKFLVSLLGFALLLAGCVDTVTGRKTAGFPLIKDRIQSSYERPMDEVFDAAKQVVAFNGAIVSEGILHGQTNSVTGNVRTLEGKVNQCTVWVRVEQTDPKITSVAVQTRTSGGGSNIDLAAEIDKQIALKLVR